MTSAPHNPAEASQKYQAVNPAALGRAMATGRQLPNARARVTGPLELTRAAAHAARSVVKTTVLRQGRTAPQEYEARLDTCRNCPGGHATFRGKGELHTCGPMVESLREAGEKTCGCVLKLKAVDAKEDCPYGYWPTLESRQIVRGEEPQVEPATVAATKRSLPGLITADKTLVNPRRGRGKASSCSKRRAGEVRAYSETEMRALVRRREAERKARPFDPGRRKFIGSAAAAGAGALVFAPKVFGDEPTNYLEIEPACNDTDESYTHVAYYGEWAAKPYVKIGDNCYQAVACVRLSSAPLGLANGIDGGPYEECDECTGDPLDCLSACADNDTQPSAVVSGVTGGECDDGGGGTASCSDFNGSYAWEAFSDDMIQCLWQWFRSAGGCWFEGIYVQVVLNKSSEQLGVFLWSAYDAWRAENVTTISCSAGTITGSASLEPYATNYTCSGTVTVTFG